MPRKETPPAWAAPERVFHASLEHTPLVVSQVFSASHDDPSRSRHPRTMAEGCSSGSTKLYHKELMEELSLMRRQSSAAAHEIGELERRVDALMSGGLKEALLSLEAEKRNRAIVEEEKESILGKYAQLEKEKAAVEGEVKALSRTLKMVRSFKKESHESLESAVSAGLSNHMDEWVKERIATLERDLRRMKRERADKIEGTDAKNEQHADEGFWSAFKRTLKELDGSADPYIADKQAQLRSLKRVRREAIEDREMTRSRNTFASRSKEFDARAKRQHSKRKEEQAAESQLKKGSQSDIMKNIPVTKAASKTDANSNQGTFFNPFSFSKTSGAIPKSDSQNPFAFSRRSTEAKQSSKVVETSKGASVPKPTSSPAGSAGQKASGVWSFIKRVKPRFK